MTFLEITFSKKEDKSEGVVGIFDGLVTTREDIAEKLSKSPKSLRAIVLFDGQADIHTLPRLGKIETDESVETWAVDEKQIYSLKTPGESVAISERGKTFQITLGRRE